MSPHMARIGADPSELRVPGAGEAELILRQRLFKARGLAAASRALLRSELGRRINRQLLETAAAWIQAPATLDQLTDCVNLCLYLARAVTNAERVHEESGR